MRIAFALLVAATLAWIHHDTNATCGDNAKCRVALEAGGPVD